MVRLRAGFAILLSLAFVVSPTMGATSSPFGTITSALGANVGAAPASAGATVFEGDKLSTTQTGTVQVRAGAARLMLSSSSSASVADSNGTPDATLLAGTAIFSTANAKAFLLHASTADIRPETDMPTIAQVTLVNSKELVVRSKRGSMSITVDGETQIVAEGMSYRVILDPASYASAAEPQGPRGAGTKGMSGPPLKAGRSRFLLIAIIVTGVATSFALYHAMESPDRP